MGVRSASAVPTAGGVASATPEAINNLEGL
jgi:hypothetical protein